MVMPLRGPEASAASIERQVPHQQSCLVMTGSDTGEYHHAIDRLDRARAARASRPRRPGRTRPAHHRQVRPCQRPDRRWRTSETPWACVYEPRALPRAAVPAWSRYLRCPTAARACTRRPQSLRQVGMRGSDSVAQREAGRGEASVEAAGPTPDAVRRPGLVMGQASRARAWQLSTADQNALQRGAS